MELTAVQAFSYQSKSYRNGETFTVSDEKTADFLLRVGHVVRANSDVAKSLQAANADNQGASVKKSK